MKKIVLFVIAVSSAFSISKAQQEVVAGGYTLTPVIDLPASTVKNQYRSGTCWSFSGLSFLESELYRRHEKMYDLADMWLVKKDYHERAKAYVRFQGKISFGPGAESNNVMDVIAKYGIVPESVFSGLQYGEDDHVHGEFDAVLEAFVNGVIENSNSKLSTAWLNAYDNILESYLGADVKEFTYEGRTYTPIEFRDALGIVPEDYIELSSFTHQPLYSFFIFEVPDNWTFGQMYNVLLDELFQQAIYALDRGYTILWGADVSEDGFSHRDAIALIPDVDIEDLTGSEKEKWEFLSEQERSAMFYDFTEPIPEKNITPELRQTAFDDYRTQDDHGMHITGYYKDADGKVFFKVKNSWGDSNSKKGYFYASESYFKYKTLGIMIHKDALTDKLKGKLNL